MKRKEATKEQQFELVESLVSSFCRLPSVQLKRFLQLFSHFLKYLVPVKSKHQSEWFLLLSCYCFLFLMRRSFKLWAGSMNDVTRGRGSPWAIPGKTSLDGELGPVGSLLLT